MKAFGRKGDDRGRLFLLVERLRFSYSEWGSLVGMDGKRGRGARPAHQKEGKLRHHNYFMDAAGGSQDHLLDFPAPIPIRGKPQAKIRRKMKTPRTVNFSTTGSGIHRVG